MPFSNTPVISTYSSHRTSLVVPLDLITSVNASDISSGMVNVLPFKSYENDNEEVAGGLVGEPRHSFEGRTVVASQTVCRGMYIWEKTIGTVYYFVVATNGTTSKVWTSTDATTWTAVTTMAADGTGPVRFTEFIDGTNVKSLIMVDGTDGYVYTSNSPGTRIVDANFPTPHVPFPVFIDGYLFLAKAGTGDIYNSNLNAPATWTAGSFISSELYPDDIQALVKVDNYLLAVGTQGCEYFYDAAVATASPLARQEGASIPFGTSFPNSIASNKNTVIMLANNNDGNQVFKVIEGQKHADIEANTVLKLFGTRLSFAVASAATVRGSFFRQNGSLFYMFQINGVTQSSLQETIVYSVDTKIWALVGYNNALTFPVNFTSPGSTLNTSTWVAGIQSGTVFFGAFTQSSANSGDTVDRAAYIDIYQTIVVPPQSFGTLNIKTMSRLGVAFYGYPQRPITVSWIDDQITYTTPVNLQGILFTNLCQFPFITQLGSFRSRGFKITGRSNIRWLYLEMDINKGQR